MTTNHDFTGDNDHRDGAGDEVGSCAPAAPGPAETLVQIDLARSRARSDGSGP